MTIGSTTRITTPRCGSCGRIAIAKHLQSSVVWVNKIDHWIIRDDASSMNFLSRDEYSLTAAFSRMPWNAAVYASFCKALAATLVPKSMSLHTTSRLCLVAGQDQVRAQNAVIRRNSGKRTVGLAALSQYITCEQRSLAPKTHLAPSG